MAPTDGDAGHPGPKTRATRKPATAKRATAKPTTAKRATAKRSTAKRAAPRAAARAEPVAWDDVPPPAGPARNGHNDWVDYRAESASWDPWDDDQPGAEARGLNRTLGEWLEAVVPPEAQIHFFNAGREFAAGIQTTLDHHLNRGDEDGGGGAEALRIEIE